MPKPKPRRAVTDTQRLNWLSRHPFGIVAVARLHKVSHWQTLDADGQLVDVKGLRQAIDAAIRSQRKYRHAR